MLKAQACIEIVKLKRNAKMERFLCSHPAFRLHGHCGRLFPVYIVQANDGSV